MAVTRVTPDEAAKLIEQGWQYVDVRSVLEFDEGHPSGAYNVPLMHRNPQGMVANPDFGTVMDAVFAKDDKLVIGCRSGARSLRAAEQLVARGFTQIVDMRGGFAGEQDTAGKVTCEGWQKRNLPVTQTAEPGRSYDQLAARAGVK